MIEKNTLSRVLREALATGGDFAEVFLEDTDQTLLELISGKMDEAVSGRDHGAGIRVLRGVDSVYVHTNDTSEAGLMRCASQAAAAINGGERIVPVVADAPVAVPNRSPIRIAPSGVDAARKAEVIREVARRAADYDPAISQTRVTWKDWTQNITVANSEGLWVQDSRTRCRVFAMAVASDGNETQTGTATPGWQRGFEVTEMFDLPALGDEAARQAVVMLRAGLCPAGRMPVIICNGFGGVIFHEACGHSLEATSVGKEMSVFCGKLGQQIASPVVSAVDDGTIPNAWGSNNIDDEGIPTRRLMLIENGILKNYLVDRLGSRRMGMEPTGCGRRQSYVFAATSRMSNTFILPGKDRREEMLSSMGDGLYCAKMGGGSVNPLTGEFNFAVGEGYLVKNGKLDRPVRGATLIGKGNEILWNIDRVSDDLVTAQGMCGSLSGSIPTDVGQPMIRVSAITVGGRN